MFRRVESGKKKHHHYFFPSALTHSIQGHTLWPAKSLSVMHSDIVRWWKKFSSSNDATASSTSFPTICTFLYSCHGPRSYCIICLSFATLSLSQAYWPQNSLTSEEEKARRATMHSMGFLEIALNSLLKGVALKKWDFRETKRASETKAENKEKGKFST